MVRFKKLSSLLMGGTAIVLAGLIPFQVGQAESPAYPKTVQVKPGGASIFAQPKSSGEVIGEYNGGVILTPSLRVYSNEGQIWLKIGDHWVPEASLKVIEGSATTADTPKAIEESKPVTDTPPEVAEGSETISDIFEIPEPAPSQSPATPPASRPLPPPTPPKPQTRLAEVTAADLSIAINVREQPNTSSKAVLAVKPGEKAEILEQQLGEDTYTWYKLRFPDRGAEGWMRGDFVKVNEVSTKPTEAQSSSVASQPINPGSITAPAGVTVVLQAKPAQKTDTEYQVMSGQKVEISQMAKGEDGLAWYAVQLVDQAEVKGWVRGDQVRLLVNYATPKSAKLSAPPGQVVDFHDQPAGESPLPIRGVSGESVDVLKQAKGDNGYAWYSVKISDKPSAQGWVKGEYLRLGL